MLRAFLLALCMATTAVAQTTVTSSMAITGLENTRQVGDYLIVDATSQPKFEPVGLIDVKTDAANVIVRVTDADRRALSTVKLDDDTYLIAAQGRLWIRVVCIDFAKNIYTDDETEFVIGPPTPPPPPPPPPPGPDNVPPDAFDNLGQRVAAWTAGLPANQQLGAIYKKYAASIRNDPNATITETGKQLKAELTAVPGYSQYATFSANVNADLAKRWADAPMARGTLGDYWDAVAAGLGVR